MAAFIQRLFKNRKTTPTQAPARNGKTLPDAPVPEAAAQAEQNERRQHQLDRLASVPSQQELETLASEGLTAEIRLRAAEQLDEKDRLNRVQKIAKNRDKGVAQIVRKKLQAIREQEEHNLATLNTIARLIQHARDQARSEDTKLYQARLDTLLAQWKEVEESASPEQTTEFLNAVRECRERLKGFEQQEAEKLRHQEQRSQRADTLKLLGDTLDDIKSQSPDQDPSLSSLDALQKTQENRWLEATRDTTVDKQEQKQYESQMLALRGYISALRSYIQHKETLDTWQSAEASASPQQARELLDAIGWPRGFSKPDLLQSLEKAVGQSVTPPTTGGVNPEEQKRLCKQLEQDLEALEKSLEARQLKESRQQFRAAQKQYRELDSRFSRRYQARLQLLGGQLRELDDWQGFATQPKQVALCEQMEYLADQPMEPELKAEKIKELQTEWKALGGSSDRTLWARFKSASDKAFEPCKTYFSAKSGLKQVNLQKREAICEELTTFVEVADWPTIDWKQVERIHQVARQEWKEAWPVEFRDNRGIQKRFDSLLKQIEQPLDAERERNEQTKQAIVDKARALVDLESLDEAMNAAKDLQKEWKAVGITRHRQDRKLWQAFRSACDAIFERRDSQRNEQQAQIRQADEEAGTALQEIRTVTKDSDVSALEAARQQVKELQALSLSGDLQKQCRVEEKRLQGALEKQAMNQKIQTWQSLVRDRLSQPLAPGATPAQWQALAADTQQLSVQELIVRAEILAGVDSPESDQSLRMEVQVQRLAKGMGGNSEDHKDASRSMEALVAGWCLALPGEDLTEDRAERLNRALEQLPELTE